MFSATVTDDGHVSVHCEGGIKGAMFGMTMICHSIYENKEISEKDRKIFMMYVENELADLAFADEKDMGDTDFNEVIVKMLLKAALK